MTRSSSRRPRATTSPRTRRSRSCRAVLEGNKPYDPTLWKGVAEMGWLGTAVPEAYGGAGLSHLELVLIAQELGRALAPIPFSSSVYLATEAILQAGSEAQKQKYLPKLAAGETIGTLALAEGLGDFDAVERDRHELRRQAVTGTKLPVSDGAAANLAVVVAREGSGHSLVLVDLEGEGVTRTALASFDASRPLAKLESRGRARRAARRRRPGRAGRARRARPRGGDDGLRADRRRRARARADARLHDGTLRVRPPGGLVPGAEAPHGRRLRQDADRALERLLRGLGALERQRRAGGRRVQHARRRQRGLRARRAKR